MTKLLASVRTPGEAQVAIAGGADIVDLKEPAQGALGRLPDATIAAILRAVAGRRLTSATIGDMPLAPEPVLAAVRAMAATGVDIVKLGIFAGDVEATLAALAAAARDGVRMVAVLFADRAPDLALVARCAAAGFRGVMLDTADKSAGALTRHLSETALARFIADARRHGLLAGLAGSLAAADVPRLLPLRPDYLGFRSALTAGGRNAPLDAAAVARLRALLDGEARLAGARSSLCETSGFDRETDPHSSWPALCRPSTPCSGAKENVDARDKPAHDGGEVSTASDFAQRDTRDGSQSKATATAGAASAAPAATTLSDASMMFSKPR